MISFISGIVKSVNGSSVVVDIGCLGLEVQTPLVPIQVNEKKSFFIYMHWNQEQGPSLYGFLNELDKTVFLLIISCSGIGPKLGLSLLSHLGAKSFLDAIQTSNDKALSAVSGVGAKKAEQLVVNLRDKVAKLIKNGSIDLSDAQSASQWTTVTETLTSLNYTRAEISAAMKHLGDVHADTQVPFDQLMRQALSYLAKKHTLGS